jgi:hypothetical protein
LKNSAAGGISQRGSGLRGGGCGEPTHTEIACENIPEALKLQEIEESLIATNLLFMKIVRLPTTRMAGIKDKVINVPIGHGGASKSVNSLPRTIEDAGIIQIQI